MSTYILTSMFKNEFDDKFAKRLREIITSRNSFVFIASDFETNHEKNDKYCNHWCDMLCDIGIEFKSIFVVDGRITPDEAKKNVETSDFIWLSGGDTPKQFGYIKQYGLDTVLKEYSGILFGMSAGSINLSTMAVCSLASGHYVQETYNGLGCVNISIEPHFSLDKTDEILQLSEKYKLYGVPDDSAIILHNNEVEFYGDIFIVENRKINKVTI